MKLTKSIAFAAMTLATLAIGVHATEATKRSSSDNKGECLPREDEQSVIISTTSKRLIRLPIYAPSPLFTVDVATSELAKRDTAGLCFGNTQCNGAAGAGIPFHSSFAGCAAVKMKRTNLFLFVAGDGCERVLVMLSKQSAVAAMYR